MSYTIFLCTAKSPSHTYAYIPFFILSSSGKDFIICECRVHLQLVPSLNINVEDILMILVFRKHKAQVKFSFVTSMMK